MSNSKSSALSGLKVVEFAQLVAGPMAGSFLADLGAEVVHIEDPTSGDPLRKVRVAKDDLHLWWKVSARNKRSATLNLRTPQGQEIARSLIRWADVVVTNMRPGTLEEWGIDFEHAVAENPKIIMLHVTGFGLTSALRDAPGFGKVGEAMSGVVHLTGFPDGPPVHSGFSHADSLAGLMGALGVEAALYRRAVDPDFSGELVDVALFEPLFRLIEWQVIEKDQLEPTPMRTGNKLEGSGGSVVNLFQAQDGGWVTMSAGTPRSVQTLAKLFDVDVPDQADAQELEAIGERLERATREWIEQRPAAEAVAQLRDQGIVISKIYDAADILEDPTYKERNDIIEVEDPDFGSVRMQAVLPHLARHAGTVWRTAPKLGQDNELVYRDYLGLGEDEFKSLQSDGVI
jgi:crotonobetainyl-CoA:carnitine CoA-transferase CaiB-like acyl-CoA transferase